MIRVVVLIMISVTLIGCRSGRDIKPDRQQTFRVAYKPIESDESGKQPDRPLKIEILKSLEMVWEFSSKF